jgi:hypothetical protein
MHGPINVKSPNNISKWQMGFNSAFKGLIKHHAVKENGRVAGCLHAFFPSSPDKGDGSSHTRAVLPTEEEA